MAEAGIRAGIRPGAGLAQIKAAPKAAPGAPGRGQGLPPLREDLILHEGPDAYSGAPTWVLEDPARDRFFQLGTLETEVLRRWSLGSGEAIAASIRRETLLRPDKAAAEAVIQFVVRQGLTGGPGAPGASEALKREWDGRKKEGILKFLLHRYLFFRIPLVNPDRFLTTTLPLIERLFLNRSFARLTVLAGLLGLYLISRQWDAFTHTFLHFFSLEGAVFAGATLLFTKVIHEFGHAYAAKRCGCRISSMGVAFMVMMPLLFTDTSAAWKLRSRRERLSIVSAGVTAELAIAAWAALLWSFLPDGPARSAAFMIAATTTVMTLLINMSPFMRFDGYYFLSDLLGVANLHQRSFALARHRLRRFFLGIREPVPESFPPGLERTLTVYAFATWFYRFFLFLGIAAIVYHAFFKALGIILFAVEVGVFVVLPIAKELFHWGKLMAERKTGRRAVFLVLGLALLVAAAAVPWRSSVTAPALARPLGLAAVYAPAGAQVTEMHAKEGDDAAAGALLYKLASPALEHELALLRTERETLRWQESFLLLSREAGGQSAVAGRTEAALALRIAKLEERLSGLAVKAPASGKILYAEKPLSAGEWVSEGELLAVIGTPGKLQVLAYLSEEDLLRIREGASARFVPEDGSRKAADLRLLSVDETAQAHLAGVPELASPYGGGIAAREAPPALAKSLEARGPSLSAAASGTVFVSESARYLAVLEGDAPEDLSGTVLRGTAVIEGEPESLAGRFLRYGLSVLLRETGF